MHFIKYLLLISIIYIIFYLIKPINDRYSYFVGLTIGTIAQTYYLEKVIKGGKEWIF